MGLSLGTPDQIVSPVAAGDAVEFVRRVLPPMGEGRFAALCYRSNKPEDIAKAKADGKKTGPGMGGQLFTTPEALVRKMQAMLYTQRKHNEPPNDMYLCLSLSRMGTLHPKNPNTLRAHRTIANFVSARSLWVDVDVKDGKYTSKEEALKHVDDLVQAGNLPTPTVRVDSGNGVHFYWVLDRELTLDEHHVLSRKFSDYLLTLGVHHDTQCTNDPVRVLRIPETVNVKDPNDIKPVTLIGKIDPTDLPVADIEALLGANLATVVPNLAQQQSVGLALPLTFLRALPPGAPAVLEFSDGIDPDVHNATGMNFEVMLAECPTLQDIHARNGAGDPEPLWALALMAATFAPASERLRWAHEFSSGYVGYSASETERKLQEKLDARMRSGGRIGWPRCDSFSALSQKCQGCRFSGQGRSPLHIASEAWKSTVVVATGAVLAAFVETDLPSGYTRRDGEVWWQGKREGEDVDIVVLPYDVQGAHIEETAQGAFFTAQVVHKRNPTRTLRLPIAAATGWREDASKALGDAHVALLPEQSIEARRFFVHYMQRLQAEQDNVQARDPYGWTRTRTGAVGFAYEGRVIIPGGEEHGPAPDEHLRQRFSAKGSLSEWKQAADMVLGMGRTDITLVVLSAFAAPLVTFTGLNGAMLSFFSPQSGTQKSTALKLAQSVWGHPVLGTSRLDDTAYSVTKKLGLLRHLPVYWDELQSRDQTANFAKMAFALTQGTEKSRLQADTRFRASGDWATILVSASNNSVREIMLQETAAGSAAGVNRVLEIEVKPVPLATSSAAADIVMRGLNDNHGLVGKIYAAHLLSLHDKLPAAYEKIATSFEQQTNADPEQRFWIMLASTLYLGARLANQIESGTLFKFDLPTIHAYLCDIIRMQQNAKADDVVAQGTEDMAASVVQGFINACKTENTYLETDVLNDRPGRPNKFSAISVRNTPDEQRLLRVVKAHVATDDGKARFHAQSFWDYCVKVRKLSFAAIKRDLEHFGSMTKTRAKWCAGTKWAGSLEYFYVIDLHANTSALGARFGLGAAPDPQQAANAP